MKCFTGLKYFLILTLWTEESYFFPHLLSDYTVSP